MGRSNRKKGRKALDSTDAAACPCGQKTPYSHCCQPLHQGQRQAKQADELMRSRYSAYVKNDYDYLLRTWHPSTRPSREALQSDEARQWLGLKLLSHQHDEHRAVAQVEFVARFKVQGRAVRQHERSLFERDAQHHWYYVKALLDAQNS